MIPVQQTKLFSPQGTGNGNCLAACLATLLEIELWMVPPFEEMYGRSTDSWRTRLDDWLERFFRMRLVKTEGHAHNSLVLPPYYIANGQSARGVMHSCVYHNGTLRHDPHPNDDGIISVDFTWHLEPIALEGATD